MAKILSSEAAPSEKVHYTFGTVEFDLGGNAKQSFETNDRDALANAEAHPWLTVEREQVELVSGSYVEQLKPEDDHLTAVGAEIDANDPDEVRKAEEAKADTHVEPVALDAGEDQGEAVATGHVAETLAAADDPDTFDIEDNR